MTTLGSYDEWLLSYIARWEHGVPYDYMTRRQREGVQRLTRMGYVQPTVRYGYVQHGWRELTEAGKTQVSA